MWINIWTTWVDEIYVWEWTLVNDYSAMRWPCDEGFHVPSKDEWVALYNAWINLWAWTSSSWTPVQTYLKMPFAGYRNNSSADVSSQGSRGLYWSSTRYNSSYAYYFYSNSTTLNPQNTGGLANGFSIRCFKDDHIVPDSSWTALYQGTWSAWVFRSSSLWLISLSSDWQTWITIQDKNLWATTVYNDWDTLSEANCGKYYQWGNNYWFPRTGSVTTSSTKVDARDYWPWNYYYSSTFITVSSRPYAWDTTDNANLRWWVTWVQQKQIWNVTEVYVGTTKIRPTVSYKTFTVSRTETSNPWSFNPIYSDDASGLTSGSSLFDAFFNYSAVRLDSSWNVTNEVKQTTPWQLDFSQLWTLTSGDNVMIKFPLMWIKMTKSGSTITLSITDNPDAWSDWFQYYAHSTGSLLNPWTPKSAFYLWAYEAVNNGSNILKSWSWGSPETSQTQATFCSRASANGSGYNIIWYYQRQFVNALYMMKYGNPDSQTVVGRWFVDWNHASHVTWWLDSQLSATWGENTWNTQCKLFWLEDWWGNVLEWIWWAYVDWSNNLYTQLSWYTWAVSGWEDTWSTIQHTWSGYELSSIVWNNKVLFWPNATVDNSNYDTYYCDDMYVDASCLAYVGGGRSDGSYAGAFHMNLYYGVSDSSNDLWSRIMFL